MTSNQESKQRAVLEELLQANGFTAETRFHRYTLPEFLTESGEPDLYRITANDDPSEAVRDVYEQGHICIAQQVGPGLAFAESAENEWRSAGRIGIEVRLKDVLDQGGLVYPVESVITDRIWYMTLPGGGVQVRRAT